MAINPDYLGKTFPASEPYEVSREKLREFADAIGDRNPLYRSRAAAQEAGYPDVIAPPTFPNVITYASSIQRAGRSRAELELRDGRARRAAIRVHQAAARRRRRHRPGHDLQIREVGRNSMMTTTTELRTVDGEHVCTAYSTLVERGGPA